MTALRISCIAAMLVILSVAGYGFSQEEMVVVENSVFGRPVRAPAIFEHDLHNEAAELEDCIVCHHLYVDGELVAWYDTAFPGVTWASPFLLDVTGSIKSGDEHLIVMRVGNERGAGGVYKGIDLMVEQ